MTKPLAILLLTLLLIACSRSPDGLYQSVGSEDKFRMTLDLSGSGQAKFATHSNLGNAELDRAVQGSMSLSAGTWKKEGANIVVVGNGADGKAITYRFVQQKNGDLIWDKNGARLVRAK